MRQLTPYFLKRLLVIPVSAFVILTLTFGLVSLIPGDPAVVISGGHASPAQLAAIRAQLGLNHSLGRRYLDYLQGAVHGNLGRSFYTGQSVGSSIAHYLPSTLELVIPSLALALFLGLCLGTLGAYFRRRLPDRISSFGITVTQSVPDFVLGLVGIYVLFYRLRLVPAPIGRLGVTDTVPPHRTGFLFIDSIAAGQWGTFGSAVAHTVLPALTLGIVYSSYFGKTARATLGQAMGSAQVEFARACGLPEWQVVRYAFLAARTPILTYGAILFGVLIGGDAIIETIFAWQGAGQWALNAMLNVDVPVIQGFVLVAGLITLLLYVALDFTVVALDPRLRHG